MSTSVTRCPHCQLNQFRTQNGLCRKCRHPLPITEQQASPTQRIEAQQVQTLADIKRFEARLRMARLRANRKRQAVAVTIYGQFAKLRRQGKNREAKKLVRTQIFGKSNPLLEILTRQQKP